VPVAVLDPHQRKVDLKNTMGDRRVHPLDIFRIQNNRYASHLHTKTPLPHTKKLTTPPVIELNTCFKLQTELFTAIKVVFKGKQDVFLLYCLVYWDDLSSICFGSGFLQLFMGY